MNKRLMVIFLVFNFLLLGLKPIAASESIAYPIDDAWVDINDPLTNKNGGGLRSDYSILPDCTHTRLAYLRFDVSSQTEEVTPSSSLQMYLKEAPLVSGTLSLWSTSDDWNGVDSGLGSESSLTYDNAPPLITLLDTAISGDSPAMVTFDGETLSTYINQQLPGNSGDGLVSFAIVWESCPEGTLAGTLQFEDRENSLGTGNIPQLTLIPYSKIFLPLIYKG